MGNHDHGHAAPGKVLHNRQNFTDHLRVKRRRRLVKEHDARFHGKAPGDGNPLLLSAGELRRIGVTLFRQSDPCQELHRLLFSILFGETPQLHGSKGDVTDNREVRVKVELLEDEAYLCPEFVDVGRLVGEIHAVDDKCPLVNRLKLVDCSDQGRFAGAGRAADHHHFPLLDMEIDVVEHMKSAEPLVDVGEMNHCCS